MIVTVQFKYVKMLCYYIVLVNILVFLGTFSMFLMQGSVRGTSLIVDVTRPALRWQVYIDAIVQI